MVPISFTRETKADLNDSPEALQTLTETPTIKRNKLSTIQ